MEKIVGRSVAWRHWKRLCSRLAPLGSIRQEGIVSNAQSNSRRKCLKFDTQRKTMHERNYCFGTNTSMFNCVPFHLISAFDRWCEFKLNHVSVNFLVDFFRVFIHDLVSFDLFRTLFWWITSGFQVIGCYLFCSRVQLNSDQKVILA